MEQPGVFSRHLQSVLALRRTGGFYNRLFTVRFPITTTAVQRPSRQESGPDAHAPLRVSRAGHGDLPRGRGRRAARAAGGRPGLLHSAGQRRVGDVPAGCRSLTLDGAGCILVHVCRSAENKSAVAKRLESAGCSGGGGEGGDEQRRPARVFVEGVTESRPKIQRSVSSPKKKCCPAWPALRWPARGPRWAWPR